MSDLSTPVHRTSGRDDNVRVFLLIVIMKKWKKICRIIFLAYLCNPKTNGDSSLKEKYEVCFEMRTRKTNADRRSNLMVVRRENVKSDAVIAQKKRVTGA